MRMESRRLPVVEDFGGKVMFLLIFVQNFSSLSHFASHLPYTL